MEMWVAIFLGILQGFTEFLPISSSGHLEVTMHLFKFQPNPEDNIAFVLLVHLATLVSIIIVFWQDIVKILRHDRIIIVYLVVATIPIAVIGLLFQDYFTAMASNMMVIGLSFFISAGILMLGYFQKGEHNDLATIGWRRAFIIGLFQSIAPMPGISRSGTSMIGGMMTGLDKKTATTFAFLMALPAISGAIIVKAKDIGAIDLEVPVIIAAFLAAMLSGIAAIWMVQWIIKTEKLYFFSIYLVCLGIYCLTL